MGSAGDLISSSSFLNIPQSHAWPHVCKQNHLVRCASISNYSHMKNLLHLQLMVKFFPTFLNLLMEEHVCPNVLEISFFFYLLIFRIYQGFPKSGSPYATGWYKTCQPDSPTDSLLNMYAKWAFGGWNWP